jgi:predicted secreted Zn-dependent protease
MEVDPRRGGRRKLLVSLVLVLAGACNSLPQQAAENAPTPLAVSTGTTTVTSLANALGEISIPYASMQYYDIAGSTEGELRAELNAKGPVGYDGYKSDATTKWFIGWTWPGFGTSFCTLSAPTVSYQITVIFPRWRVPANAPPPLVSKWTNFEEALGEHEKGHVDFLVTHYSSVSTAIERASCNTAEAAAQDALKPIRQHDIDYDAETNHGATQGARFP